MIRLFKYISLLLRFKDVAEIYKEEQGKEKPAYISKRVIGAAVLFAAVALAKLKGIELDEVTVQTVTDNLAAVATGVYGLILVGKGIYDKVRRK